MKQLNRLLILGILASGAAWGQLSQVRVGPSITGPSFVVDGTIYATPQSFFWQLGSNHTLQFPLSLNLDGSATYQFGPGVRYSFGGWSETGGPSPSGSTVQITASPSITAVTANVTVEDLVYIELNAQVSPVCTTVPDPQLDPSVHGAITVDGTCYNSSANIWLSPGTHSFLALPFPGYVVGNWIVNGIPVPVVNMAEYPIIPGMVVAVTFQQAKQVAFVTSPPGLNVVVDHSFAGTPITESWAPGSSHQIGAPQSQTDGSGNYWAFSGFSNGLGQNSTYVADGNVGQVDLVTANFAPAHVSSISTFPAALQVAVDGITVNQINNRYIWGEGESHSLNAPAIQTDSTGRKYQFVSWSIGGPATQTVVIPSGIAGFSAVATYQLLGQVQVNSTVPGLTFQVAGANCVTPCTLDRPSGTQIQVVAPASVSQGPALRDDFISWNSGSTSTTTSLTFNNGIQTVFANYQILAKLSAIANPSNGATFKFSPTSPDGFYAVGSQVSITVTPNGGFKFRAWDIDASGTSTSTSVAVTGIKTAEAVLDKVPFLPPAGIVNAAAPTPDATVAPGSLVAVYGQNFTDTFIAGPTNPLSQALGDITVTVNNRLLPLLYISPSQINVQMFSDLADGDYTLVVHSTKQQDVSGTFTIRRDSPGIFTWFPPHADPTAAALHEDGSQITADSPAKRNETIWLFGTGFGPFDHPTVDGFPIPDNPTYKVADPVTIQTGLLVPDPNDNTKQILTQTQTLSPNEQTGPGGSTGLVLLRIKITSQIPSGLVALSVSEPIPGAKAVNGVTPKAVSNTVMLPVQ